ncbi:peptidase U32 family protein [Desulfohalovibrio reitneri]|uniref:peptidase U32 family protein n=1 Tax=Desulfohalovibrio reitneri TaxID=1307759 RepID=UPI0004A6B635|nr:U32 family peptidase [Desulfohalovibrio reitneri]
MNAATPQILAPAGDPDSFLAALAAGADAVYAAPKHFSARMEADNFGVRELGRLRELAEKRGAELHVPLNVMLKPDEVEQAGRMLARLSRDAAPHALIFSDPAVPALARAAGFKGRLNLSTLGAATHPAAMAQAARLGVERVILPRELTIDEIRQFDQARPEGVDLEVFVHGALCYGVSGRCWWSSFLGGKSGLRGRCVQPCRRYYSGKGAQGRLFSCRDLSLDVLVKLLAETPGVACWKIEGRKKGPHYVYYTVAAYRALRDGQGSADSKKLAMDLLEQALGRPSTHGSFLPQKPHPVVTPATSTASGLFVGKIGKPYQGKAPLTPRQPLLKDDRLRVGSEDEPGHMTLRVTRNVPKGGRYDIRPKDKMPRPGTPVLLIDRREPELLEALAAMRKELEAIPTRKPSKSPFKAPKLKPAPPPKRMQRLDVHRRPPSGRPAGEVGIWLKPGSPRDVNRTMRQRLWWWMPPVLWPGEEEWARLALRDVITSGARRIVLNAPWQMDLLPEGTEAEVWAGPFCNLGNPQAVQAMAELGFSGAFVSPELPREDLLAMPLASPLPLGLVVGGMWPLCLSRHLADEVKVGMPYFSPKGEPLWARTFGETTWVYPGWPVDLSKEIPDLRQAGYTILANLHESKPKSVPHAQRISEFNYRLKLL